MNALPRLPYLRKSALNGYGAIWLIRHGSNHAEAERFRLLGAGPNVLDHRRKVYRCSTKPLADPKELWLGSFYQVSLSSWPMRAE